RVRCLDRRMTGRNKDPSPLSLCAPRDPLAYLYYASAAVAECMEFLEGKALSRHLLERYVRDPRGWNFVVAPARRHGFFDGIFSSPEEAWHIKLDSIFKPN